MAFQMDSHKGGVKEIKPEHYITEMRTGMALCAWSVKVPIAPAAKISGWIHLGMYPNKEAALARVQKYLDIALPKEEVSVNV
jgi:hypothetical protein